MSLISIAADASRGGISLLEALPDLQDCPAAELPAMNRSALYVSAVDVGAGPWQPAEDRRLNAETFGLIIVTGLIVRETRIGAHVSAQLAGPGDLLPLVPDHQEALPVSTEVTVVNSARFAVLDGRALLLMRRWPALVASLTQRSLRQVDHVTTLQAIAQLPRVTDRLLALFWHLADDWGTVNRHGVAVNLQLTHEILGQLIGGRRSTVTLGLKQLSGEGHLRRSGDGSWLLAPDSINQFKEDVTPIWTAIPAGAAAA